MAPNHSTIRGKILYTSKKPDRMDQERGREYFRITRQADGISTLQAHCEIDDAPDVLRDVYSAFDSDTMRPYDGSVRLSVGSKFEGTGWFKFTDKVAECETFNQRDGRISQKLDIPAAPTWFGHHAIVNDGLLSRIYDLSTGPGKIRLENVMMSSPDHRGATGPLIFPMAFGLRYDGPETITVGAGTFDANKFSVVDTAGELPEEHPPYEMWCTADEDGIFLRGGVGGYMMTHYELVEYQKDHA